MGEIAGAREGSDMQASLLDIGRVSRFARIGRLKQPTVVETASAISPRPFLSDGSKWIISRPAGTSGLQGGRRQCNPVSSDDQNDPLANICSGSIVLERNIVNQMRPTARDAANALSRSIASGNRALEQSLVRCLSVRSSTDAGAVEPVHRGAPKAGTNGEGNRGVKLYARLQSTLAKESRATFTECYAVLAMIRDGTPGKGDGS